MHKASQENLWQGSDLDFEAVYATKWRLHARALPAWQSNTIKVKANASRMDMFSLPILWSVGSKSDELRRLSESADLTAPLKALSERSLRDLPTMTQADHFGLSNANYGVKVVECAVLSARGHSAHFASDVKDDRVWPSEEPVLRQSSAIHDIGIPEPCTDIVHLLIDDLLHMSEEKVERYYRVWCRSGAATLVSSTTTRSFNAAGCLVEVSHRAAILK
jgi:hypothetical protein